MVLGQHGGSETRNPNPRSPTCLGHRSQNFGHTACVEHSCFRGKEPALSFQLISRTASKDSKRYPIPLILLQVLDLPRRRRANAINSLLASKDDRVCLFRPNGPIRQIPAAYSRLTDLLVTTPMRPVLLEDIAPSASVPNPGLIYYWF
jgi:hypothetical protein